VLAYQQTHTRRRGSLGASRAELGPLEITTGSPAPDALHIPQRMARPPVASADGVAAEPISSSAAPPLEVLTGTAQIPASARSRHSAGLAFEQLGTMATASAGAAWGQFVSARAEAKRPRCHPVEQATSNLRCAGPRLGRAIGDREIHRSLFGRCKSRFTCLNQAIGIDAELKTGCPGADASLTPTASSSPRAPLTCRQ